MKYEVKCGEEFNVSSVATVSDDHGTTRNWIAKAVVVGSGMALMAAATYSFAVGEMVALEVSGCIFVPVLTLVLGFYFGRRE